VRHPSHPEADARSRTPVREPARSRERFGVTRGSLWGSSPLGVWCPVLAVVLLCLVAIAPLLRTVSPCTHDGGLHYHRVVAMDHALKNGVLFTRYLPDLAFGYGYPFFNYREPASYYLMLALYVAGLPLPLVLNLVYAASILGGALGAYLLARDLFGPTAGIVAAVGYAYAPYQFLDALTRGNATEAVALGLLPFILWAFHRLALKGCRRDFLLSAGALAMLYLTHYISSLIFTPLLAAYLAVLWLIHHEGGRAEGAFHWGPVVGAAIVAAGLAAFCLGPALLEQRYVQLHMSRVTRNNDFHYNFLGLAEALAPPTPVDTSLMNPPMEVHLGAVLAVLGAIGFVSGLIRSRNREQRATLVFLALASVVTLWMSTRGSLWLWEHVPLLPFVQFPWRFVGRAILPLALLASAVFLTDRLPEDPAGDLSSLRPSARLLPILLHLSLLTLILSAFPNTYPPKGYCPAAPYPSIGDVFAYEHRSGLVGVDPEGSYFPVWVKERPKGSPLEAQYAAGGPVARFDQTTLPEGGVVVEATYRPNQARVVVSTPTPFRARYLAFYFPGWRVQVDGEPVPVTASDSDGLITFEVPAGQHTVTIRFGETPLRIAFDVISIASLALLIVAVIEWGPLQALALGVRRATPSAADPAARPDCQKPGEVARRSLLHRPVAHCLSLVLLAVLLLALKLGVVDRVETVFRHPALQPDGTLPGVEHRLERRYADGLMLIGFDQSAESIPGDGVLRLDLYWSAYARPSARYQSVVHLVGADGLRWSLPDSFRPRGYADYPPTKSWRPGQYALDSHEVEPLTGAPPGTYDVVLTMFDRDTLAPLSVLDEQDRPSAPELTLGQVALAAPSRPADPGAMGIRHRLDVPLGPITLLGAHLDRDEACPGDLAMFTSFWRAERQPVGDIGLRLVLLAPDDTVAVEYDLPPAVSWYPTSLWRPGDVWRGRQIIRFPAGLESGDHAWRLSTGPEAGFVELPWTTTIRAPEHTFTSPPVQHPVNVTLGGLATLVGFDLSAEAVAPDDAVTVTLVWRAEETPAVSYHVFLHLLDAGGELVTQSDGIPAEWTRPTTGWLPGEIITDVHTLTMPADAPVGEYVLSAGLYVPGGERLVAADGTAAVRLTTLFLISDDRP